MISVGQRVRFNPFAGIKFYGVHAVSKKVIGTVIMVNDEHRWFLVEYGRDKMRVSFNFCDVGNLVTIIS